MIPGVQWNNINFRFQVLMPRLLAREVSHFILNYYLDNDLIFNQLNDCVMNEATNLIT